MTTKTALLAAAAAAAISCSCISLPSRPWLDRLLVAPMCPLPCWEGVTPGVTKAEAARNLMGSLYDARFGRAGIAGQDWWLDKRDHAFLEVDNGVVTRLVLDMAVGEEPELGRFISAWGMPSLVTLTSCLHGSCVVELSYPTRGAILSLMLPDVRPQGFGVDVSETAPVGRLDLVPDVDLWMSEAAWFEAPPTEWRGYGEYL